MDLPRLAPDNNIEPVFVFSGVWHHLGSEGDLIGSLMGDRFRAFSI